MPGAIQSFRILYAEGAGKTVTYVVPTGKRVSVKYVTAQNESPADAFVYVGVHGIYAFRLYLPATDTAQRAELMMVAYERESIALITTGSNTHAMLSGFVFDDPVGNPARELDGPQAGTLPDLRPGA